MIGIINYGLGNIKAFANVYKSLNIEAIIVEDNQTLDSVDKIILPGVGAFDYAMERLEKSGMKGHLNDLVLERKVPVLGICVGMQILGSSSEEGDLAGLGWIDAEIKRFDTEMLNGHAQLPHMGWNDVRVKNNHDLFEGLSDYARFYFLHSYYFHCDMEEYSIAETEYGSSFTSAIKKDNIYGVQFHPEKSHSWGIKLLSNFAKI